MTDLTKYTPKELRERLKHAILSLTDEQMKKLETLYQEVANESGRNAQSD